MRCGFHTSREARSAATRIRSHAPGSGGAGDRAGRLAGRALLAAGLLALAALGVPAQAQPPDLAIQAAGVEIVAPGVLQFWMEVGAPPAQVLGDARTYLWLVDTDRDASTGQPHGPVGSEYNVRVVIGAESRITGGFVDGIDRPGGPATPFTDGTRITARVRLDTLGDPAALNWNCEAFAEQSGYDGSPDARTLEVTEPDPVPGQPVRVVAEPCLALRNGVHAAAPWVRAWDAGGSLLDLSGRTIRVFALPASLVTVEGTTLTALPGKTGQGLYTASVDGILSANTGRLTVGSLDIEPGILHLNVSGRPDGKLAVKARDADGAEIPPAGHVVTYETADTSLIDLSSDGTVHARPDVAGVAWVRGTFDGYQTTNVSGVRVLRGTTVVPDVAGARGRNVVIWYPAFDTTAPRSLQFAASIDAFDMVNTIDRMYDWEAVLTGFRPFSGGLQHLGLVCSDADYEVCGLSGNTAQFGFTPAGTGGGSCFLLVYGEAGIPHWGVIGHEIGHNFVGQMANLSDILTDGRIASSSGWAFSEGLASVCHIYARSLILAQPGQNGVIRAVTDSWRDPAVYDSLPFDRTDSVDGSLAIYLREGARYPEGFNPGVLCGMVFELADRYGWDTCRRFFSIFLPPDEPLGFLADSETKRATFFVTAMSAAADRDLRPAFRAWGFPIDDAVFAAWYERLRLRVASGPPVLGMADVVSALRCAGGQDGTSGWDIARRDGVGEPGRLDVADAVHLARKMAGLDAHP